MGYYINTASVMALGILFPVLGIVAVALRFVARYQSAHKFGWDDWLCIPALLFNIAGGVIFIIGAARHLFGTRAPPEYTTTPQVALASEYQALTDLQTLELVFWIIGVLAIGCIKLSILLFYRRLFRGKVFNFVYYTMLAIVCAWMVTFFFSYCFMCGTNIQDGLGDFDTLKAKCVDIFALGAAVAISDFIVDVALLIMPMPWVWRLQMPTAQKVILTIIFTFGSFAIGASFYRMIIWIKVVMYPLGSGGDLFGVSGNDTFAVVSTLMFWSYIEIGVALVTCCLPSLRALSKFAFVAKIWRKLCGSNSVQSFLTYFKAGSTSAQRSNGSIDISGEHRQSVRLVDHVHPTSRHDEEKGLGHELDVIKVRTEMETAVHTPSTSSVRDSEVRPGTDFDALYNSSRNGPRKFSYS